MIRIIVKIVMVIILMTVLSLIKVEAKSSLYTGSGRELSSSLNIFSYSFNYEYFIKDDLPIRAVYLLSFLVKTSGV